MLKAIWEHNGLGKKSFPYALELVTLIGEG